MGHHSRQMFTCELSIGRTKEEDDEEGGDYEYVLTDEWMEFFAKSEARRQESKYCFFSQI